MPDLEQTIVAEATAQGRAPLRVVRLSGERSFELLRCLFHPDGGGAPWDRPRVMTLGQITDRKGRTLDKALAVCFAGPASLTGEDVVEIHLHGAAGVVRAVMDRLVEGGARPALPGEFSYRAVLNGKMDLLEAEAVQALVEAGTEGQALRIAGGVGGALSRELKGLRESVLDLRAAWESRVDFPEDVGEVPGDGDLHTLSELIERMAAFAESGRRIRCLREGLRLALVGPVNSGKSSLFNALLKRERALVTPHAGTTRDTLEETIQIGGFPVVLIDTAGIRDTLEPVETAGVQRSLEAAGSADGVLMIYDGVAGWGRAEDETVKRLPASPLLRVSNKADLDGHDGPAEGAIATSAVTGAGLDVLVDRLTAWVQERVPGASVCMVSERQARCLADALKGCLGAREALAAGCTEEVALGGLREAQAALDELMGGGSPEDLYDRIFSRFCIGK